MRKSPRRALAATLATATAAAALIAVTGGLHAGASTAQPAAEDFYDPPSPLPAGENGDIIRSEPAEFYLDPAKGIPAPAEVQRIMYRSTDTHGEPMAVTGTVLTPNTPWMGIGDRPIIGYAVGTQGMGDQCAPSRQLAAGTEYEGLFLSGLLQRGYGVAVTDYQGLGTPGLHTYVNRVAEGNAVLDSIRAAQRLDAADLPASGPVATAGYSQGGGASASAAELAADYAPELELKGSYAGAPPADKESVGKHLDGSHAAGLLGYAVGGLQGAYPELDIWSLLNEKGTETFKDGMDDCVIETVAKNAFTNSEDLTADGRPIEAYMQEEPFKSRVAEQKLGERKPAPPTLVLHSRIDDIVPFDQGRQMAVDWCDQGGNVKFQALTSPTHIGGVPEASTRAFLWLEERFSGLPQLSNCGRF